MWHFLPLLLFICNFSQDSQLPFPFHASVNQWGTMGTLTTTASVGLVGRTSVVNPFDRADVFSGASSCLNDDEPSSKGLKLLSFFFSLLALVVRVY